MRCSIANSLDSRLSISRLMSADSPVSCAAAISCSNRVMLLGMGVQFARKARLK